MSTRGTILLAIGMLILGLLIGGLTGGVAGFFAGQSSQIRFAQRFQLPIAPPTPQSPQTQPTSPAPTPFMPRGLPPALTVLGAARVEEVEKDSPAEKAGLQVGDIITAVGTTKLDANHSLGELIQAQKPGDKVDLSITRGRQTMIITVELGKSPQDSTKAYLGVKYSTVPGGRWLPGR
jgi:membrane-associated protease RseP (regulator of RpoE activity)